VVVNTDFSNGADAIIADGSIPDVAALKGKKVAAEVGLTPQFLLNQGLASEGLAQGDLTFRGVATDAAAAGFASGQFDAVAVFAPYTLEALKRPGAKVLFDSADLRGAIPDHIVFNADAYAERPDDIQKFVNAWYTTVAWIKENPVEARAIMATQAGLSVDDYAEIEKAVDILGPAEALEIFTDSEKTTSLPNTARKADAFLQKAELTKEAADLTGLFAPEFTRAYVDGMGK
jgi:NitT/TauT family transport system substrate-binding protein